MNGKMQLQGLSGANLNVFSASGRIIVRKTAASPSGNDRLMRQEAKQRSFLDLGSNVGSPFILDSGYDDSGRFYFDMEFIGGQDGHRFLERCSPNELDFFASQLADHISNLKDLPIIGEPSIYASLYDSCVHKIAEISHRQAGLDDSLTGCIIRQLDCIRDLSINSSGFCHGDFTLENILVDMQGRIHFVDFLDSAFEHPIQDLVKLSQDIHGGWFLARGKRLSSAVISYLENRIKPAIETSFPKYYEVLNVLQAVNFSRILPYVKDDKQKSFVLNTIKRFTNY